MGDSVYNEILRSAAINRENVACARLRHHNSPMSAANRREPVIFSRRAGGREAYVKALTWRSSPLAYSYSKAASDRGVIYMRR